MELFGTITIGELETDYNIGTIGIIPENVNHKVKAGEDGLYILAKFFQCKYFHEYVMENYHSIFP